MIILFDQMGLTLAHELYFARNYDVERTGDKNWLSFCILFV